MHVSLEANERIDGLDFRCWSWMHLIRQPVLAVLQRWFDR